MANQMNPFFVGGGMQMGNHMMTGLGASVSGMDPASNNQPLQFNTSKGKAPMAVSGEQQLKDIDLRQKSDRAADISEAPMGGMGGMMGSWNPMMTPSMSHMGDMMMSYSQYGFMGTPLPMSSPDGASPTISGQKEIITLKSAILYPPPPNAPPPSLRERPPGCRTIFVGGLPETITDDIIRDMFENCGSITSMRISKKNFAHVRFDFEESVDKSLYLSGYRIKIENKDDKLNTGRLHVDYAQARDDLYEWECKARTYAREERHRIRIEEERLRPPSPPPITHFSDHEAAVLMESLKNEEGFNKAAQILTTWLTRGDCNRRTSNTFYSLVQGVHSHVKRLQTDKMQHDEELEQIRLKFRLRMEGILRQFEQIEQVFAHASKQKVWDHFSKAQRKNLDAWRKQAQEIRHSQQEEYFNERNEAEMEMSDSDMEESTPVIKKMKKESVAPTPEAQAISAQDWAAMSQVRIENEDLKTQLEAYKNEVELLKQEQLERHERQGEDEGKQVRALQQALQGMQQQLMAAKQEIKKAEEDMLALKTQSDQRAEEESSSAYKSEDDTSRISSSVQPLTDKEARLIGLLSTFLHVHPTGASVDYIWSYLHRLNIPVRTSELEDVLERFPHMFRRDLSGVGASLEKRWTFVGFNSS